MDRVGSVRDQRIEGLRRRGRESQSNARKAAGRKSARQFRPRRRCRPGVSGLINTATPERGIDSRGSRRIDANIRGVESWKRRAAHFGPVHTAVEASINAIARSREQPRGRTGRDGDATEASAGKGGLSQRRPSVAAVCGSKHAIAVVAVTGEVAFTCPRIENEMVTWVHCERANGERNFVVSLSSPIKAAVRSFPDTSLCRADIDNVGVARVNDDRGDSACDKYTRRGVSLTLRNSRWSHLNPIAYASRRRDHLNPFGRGGGKCSGSCHGGSGNIVPPHGSRMF